MEAGVAEAWSEALGTPGWHGKYEDYDVRLSRGRAKLKKLVVEHYLREDIPCASALCSSCSTPPCSSALSSSAPHYVIPDDQSLIKYMEIWESPELCNIIFLASVLKSVLVQNTQRTVTRAKQIFMDVCRESVYFDDMHFMYTWLMLKQRESIAGEKKGRKREAGVSSSNPAAWFATPSTPFRHSKALSSSVLAAADWYMEHLNFQMPIYVVSDSIAELQGRRDIGDAKAASRMGHVVVLSNRDYFDMFWTHCRQVDILVDYHIRLRPDDGAEDRDAGPESRQAAHDFRPYLSKAAVEEGLAHGSLHLGTFLVLPDESKVVVRISQRGLLASEYDVIIPSRLLQNRALHGNLVAVRELEETEVNPAWTGAGADSMHGGSSRGSQASWGGRKSRDNRGWEAGWGERTGGRETGRDEGTAEWEGGRGGERPWQWSKAGKGDEKQWEDKGVGEGVEEGQGPGDWEDSGGWAEQGRGAASALFGEVVAVTHAQERDYVVALLDDVSPMHPSSSTGSGSLGDMGQGSWRMSRSGSREPGTGSDAGSDVSSRSSSFREQPLGHSSSIRSSSSSSSRPWFGALCQPVDPHYPRMFLRTRHSEQLAGLRFVVRVDRWSRQQKHPDCHLVSVLGPLDHFSTAEAAILVEQGIHPRCFGEKALKELPEHSAASPWVVPDREIRSRRDLRGLDFACSVDPPGSTDVDDVLSVHRGASGLVEIGVHIADVSHFVRPGSFLDAEARTRGTTVYMLTDRFHMLPSVLSETVCSLREGEDRLAVSLVWTVDVSSAQSAALSAAEAEKDKGRGKEKKGQGMRLVSTWFGRTVIRSQHQLSYSQAQAILDKKALPLEWELKGGDTTLQKARVGLTLLSSFADVLRKQRQKKGSLVLNAPELRFHFGKNGEPESVKPKAEDPMNAVIAELMVFANSCVARKVHCTFPHSALLRRHDLPRPDAFERLTELLTVEGVSVASSTNKDLSKALAAIRAKGDASLEAAVGSLVTRSLSEAEYVCSSSSLSASSANPLPSATLPASAPASASMPGAPASALSYLQHYGLAVGLYTHFTSPIRRYADVVAHRQLLAALERDSHNSTKGSPGEESNGRRAKATIDDAPDASDLSASQLADLSQHLNAQHRAAKIAQKRATELATLRLLLNGTQVVRAVVTALHEGGCTVYLPKFDLDCPLTVSDSFGHQIIPALDHVSSRRASFGRSQYSWELQAAAPGIPSRVLKSAVIVDQRQQRPFLELRVLQRLWVEVCAQGSAAHWPSISVRWLPDGHFSVPSNPTEGPCTSDADGAGAFGTNGSLRARNGGTMERSGSHGSVGERGKQEEELANEVEEEEGAGEESGEGLWGGFSGRMDRNEGDGEEGVKEDEAREMEGPPMEHGGTTQHASWRNARDAREACKTLGQLVQESRALSSHETSLVLPPLSLLSLGSDACHPARAARVAVCPPHSVASAALLMARCSAWSDLQAKRAAKAAAKSKTTRRAQLKTGASCL